jgi:hypothetical protein
MYLAFDYITWGQMWNFMPMISCYHSKSSHFGAFQNSDFQLSDGPVVYR